MLHANQAGLLRSVVWEYPCDEQQGSDFLALLAATRAYLPEEQYLLTAALPANKAVLQCINLGEAALYLDFLNLTAYDFFGSWTPRTGHQSQLYAMSKDETSASAGVGCLMQAGVPGKKILLGIPLFGRSFLHATGPGQKFKGVGGEDGSFEYKDLPRRGTKEQVDKRSVAAQCVGGDGGFVTYDNPDTVKMKAAFCKQKGLGVSDSNPSRSRNDMFCLTQWSQEGKPGMDGRDVNRYAGGSQQFASAAFLRPAHRSLQLLTSLSTVLVGSRACLS